jgi:kelch-like protein 9/13
MNHSMAEVQNNLYVIGGNVEDNYGFPVPVIAIEKYCPVANQWTLCLVKPELHKTFHIF